MMKGPNQVQINLYKIPFSQIYPIEVVLAIYKRLYHTFKYAKGATTISNMAKRRMIIRFSNQYIKYDRPLESLAIIDLLQTNGKSIPHKNDSGGACITSSP
jgi:hypothetical protein